MLSAEIVSHINGYFEFEIDFVIEDATTQEKIQILKSILSKDEYEKFKENPNSVTFHSTIDNAREIISNPKLKLNLAKNTINGGESDQAIRQYIIAYIEQKLQLLQHKFDCDELNAAKITKIINELSIAVPGAKRAQVELSDGSTAILISFEDQEREQELLLNYRIASLLVSTDVLPACVRKEDGEFTGVLVKQNGIQFEITSLTESPETAKKLRDIARNLSEEKYAEFQVLRYVLNLNNSQAIIDYQENAVDKKYFPRLSSFFRYSNLFQPFGETPLGKTSLRNPPAVGYESDLLNSQYVDRIPLKTILALKKINDDVLKPLGVDDETIQAILARIKSIITAVENSKESKEIEIIQSDGGKFSL